jgi:methionyl-tRNA formyltransferase
MSNHPQPDATRCLFFGTPCAFASPILAALSRPGVHIVGVVSPHPGPGSEPFVTLPAARQRASPPLHYPLSQFSATRYLARDITDPGLAETLAALRPDLIVVACYPRLIPASLAATARSAAVNVHPSLLPRHRGPDPLFWTFHAGEHVSGVSVHRVSPEFDAGDILGQQHVAIQPGESLAALERRLAAIGAGLISDLIAGLPDLPPVQPQTGAIRERLPCAEDLVIDQSWSVDRARTFIAGVGRSHGPLAYRAAGDEPVSITALAAAGDGRDIQLVDGRLAVV